MICANCGHGGEWHPSGYCRRGTVARGDACDCAVYVPESTEPAAAPRETKDNV